MRSHRFGLSADGVSPVTMDRSKQMSFFRLPTGLGRLEHVDLSISVD